MPYLLLSSSFFFLIIFHVIFQKVVKEDGRVEPEFADAEEGQLHSSVLNIYPF